MAVFFEGSAKRCFHIILELGHQGCPTVLAKVQVGWTLFLEKPVGLALQESTLQSIFFSVPVET